MQRTTAWRGTNLGLGLATVVSIACGSKAVQAEAGSSDDSAGTIAAADEGLLKLAEFARSTRYQHRPKRGGFGLKRRSKPPDYLLPKKEDAAVEQDGGAQPWQNPDEASGGNRYAESLAKLKGLYDKGLIETQEYEATRIRILTDLNPAESGVEGGLLLLRQLWDQGLISEAPTR